MALTQTHYRFRNDDGNETAATWAAALDTPVVMADANADFRLRVSVQGSGVSDDEELGLQYRLNGGTWNTPTGAVISVNDSAHVADGAPTTQQITSGTFEPGIFDDANAETDVSIAMGTGSTEVEFSLSLVAADITDGDEVEFRLLRTGGFELFAYSVTPLIYVGAAVPVPDIPPTTDPAVVLRSKAERFVAIRGGHGVDYFEPLYTDPETITVDKFNGLFPDVMRKKRWRPNAEYAYTEVPVPPDVVEHGWEFTNTQVLTRWRARRNYLLGSYCAPPSQDPLTTSYLTILGVTTIEPTYYGLSDVTPTYAGESSLNAEGE